MTYTAGIDVGSTYTKAVILSEDKKIVGKGMINTGFKLIEAATKAYHMALAESGLWEKDVKYIATTGYGRFLIPFRDVYVTDLTAQARGARYFFPETRTVLDVGGQTMKACKLDADGKVRSFRLNDKCAAGTGAFLEKTARYMSYRIEEIGPLMATSKQAVAISGVCAVFAESEVINHVSAGIPPADIMHGAIVSLVERSVQLMKRVQMEPEYTLVGGILRFETMARVVADQLKSKVNVPAGDMPQFTAAVGAAILAHRRLEKINAGEKVATHDAVDSVVA
ncbi:2-hydroxyisocaproyl-CoA dehydratase activator [Anaerolineae bacterium]|nr:2-hydroxyisocaproyl-CoA dehydratase activator [Anaerolineae bacterium]